MGKRTGLLFLLFIIGVVLAACNSDGKEAGGTGSEENVSGEITVWVHPYTDDATVQDEMFSEIVANYNEEFPDVEVTVETLPWADRDQKILTALAANNGPDVFYAIPDQMPQYADQGMLLELDPYLEDYDLDDFQETALDATTWQDTLYGLPILQEATALFYNQEIIEEIEENPENLPETWEEFEEWARKAKELDKYALSYPGGGALNHSLFPFLWQAGGGVISEDGEILINSSESIEAFEFVNNMYQNGYFPEDSISADNHDELWYDGQLLAILGSGMTLRNMQDTDEFDYVIGPPLKNKEQKTYGNAGMFVVPSNTDNPDAASEFVKTATNEENQRLFNSTTQYIPPRDSARDIFEEGSELSQLASYTEYGVPGVIHPVYRPVIPSIQAEVQSMLAGEKTAQEATDAVAESIQEELDNY